MVREIPPLVFAEILVQFKKFVEENAKTMSLLLLKQVNIELEFLQAVTVPIKSIASQQLFASLYALIKKTFEAQFASDPKNVAMFKIDVNKFNKVLRETKFKTKLNFKSFINWILPSPQSVGRSFGRSVGRSVDWVIYFGWPTILSTLS